MSPQPGTLHWELHLPPGDSQPPWLAELSAMRGQVLYADGRRPSFRLPDGSFADADPLDAYAYHLLARQADQVAGTCRLLPLASAPTCVTESLLVPELFEQLLRVLETPRVRMSEPSRWLVQWHYRKTKLAMQLAAGIWAVARWLGHERSFTMVGIRDGQDRMFLRVGAHLSPGIPVLSSDRFADELRCLYFDVGRPAEAFAGMVNQMGQILGLQRRARTRVPKSCEPAELLGDCPGSPG
jgi:N-acyl-L-homoserine lactone synthetase